MSDTAWDELGQRWQDLLTRQAELTHGWFEGPWGTKAASDAAAASGDTISAMTEMWRSWIGLNGSVGQTWLPPANGADGSLLNPMSLSLFGGSQISQAIRRLTEGPQFADVGTAERRVARLTELWLEVQTASGRYQQLTSEAWTLVNQRFAISMAERHGPGADAPPGREGMRIWLGLADQTLMECYRSEDFLAARQRLMRAGIDFLLAQRELVESMAGPAGFPTRAEIDEVHQSVQELKRRVRALEKTRGSATAGSTADAVS